MMKQVKVIAEVLRGAPVVRAVFAHTWNNENSLQRGKKFIISNTRKFDKASFELVNDEIIVIISIVLAKLFSSIED